VAGGATQAASVEEGSAGAGNALQPVGVVIPTASVPEECAVAGSVPQRAGDAIPTVSVPVECVGAGNALQRAGDVIPTVNVAAGCAEAGNALQRVGDVTPTVSVLVECAVAGSAPQRVGDVIPTVSVGVGCAGTANALNALEVNEYLKGLRKMRATKATNIVVEFLRERFGRVWVHPRGTRAFGKLDLPVHRVAVAGWYPDILCRLQDDRVVSVVLELESDEDGVLRGLGRAVTLRGSVHAVFLAGEAEVLNKYRDTILSAGVGLFAVSRKEHDIDLVFPPAPPLGPNIYPQHMDVLRELEVLEKRKARRRFPSLAFDHPLHFIATVLAIRPGTPQPKQEVASLLLERWGYEGSRTESWWNSLYGGLFLGLVEEQEDSETLKLTELGYQARTALLSRYSAADLRGMTTGNKPLVELSPNVAFLARALYLTEPDSALILSLIAGLEDEKFSFIDLLSTTLQRFPNAVMSLFIKPEAQADFAMAWRNGKLGELLRPKTLGEIVHPAIVGPYKKQLVHIGVLSSESRIWKEEDAYLPEKDTWIRKV